MPVRELKAACQGRTRGGGEGIGGLQQTGDSDMDVSFNMLVGFATIYHSFTSTDPPNKRHVKPFSHPWFPGAQNISCEERHPTRSLWVAPGLVIMQQVRLPFPTFACSEL